VISHENEGNNEISKVLTTYAALDWELNVLSKENDINHLKVYEYNGNWSLTSLGIENLSMEYETKPLMKDNELITGSLDGKVIIYDENLTETVIVDVGARSYPELVDLNSDGEDEILVGSSHGLHRFNLSDNSELFINFTGRDVRPTFSDLDNDNDYDMIVGGETLVYYENIGNSTNPIFVMGNLTLPSLIDVSPVMFDFDDDGDDDLFVATNGSLLYFENNAGFIETDIGLPSGDLFDIYKSGNIYLVVSQDNNSDMNLRASYTEPVGVQIINYAHQSFEYMIKHELFNDTKVTDLLLDKTFFVDKESATELFYDIEIPFDILNGLKLGVVAEAREKIERTWINESHLGGYTTVLDTKPNTRYEIDKTHRIYINGSMSSWEDCNGYCELQNLEDGSNKIVIDAHNANLYSYETQIKKQHVTYINKIPALSVTLYPLKLREGYLEDISFSLSNNNRVDLEVDRISLQYFDPITSKLYDLYTDTSGLTLVSGTNVEKTYKIFVPSGLPENGTFMLRVVSIDGLTDSTWYRNYVDDFPINNLNSFYLLDGVYHESDLPDDVVYSMPPSEITNDDNWGWQDITSRTPVYQRKHQWIEGSLIKAEINEIIGPQACALFVPIEEIPHMTTWINKNYTHSFDAEWTPIGHCRILNQSKYYPIYNNLELGNDNVITIFKNGYGYLDIKLYKTVNMEIFPDPFVESDPALEIELTSVGINSLLRRGYEEDINLTIKNNDDDNLTIEVITFDLVSGETIHLYTDTTQVVLPALSTKNLNYKILIPVDAPLDAEISVGVERIYNFPDKLWLRNSIATEAELIDVNTNDLGWGDTLPTTVSSNYRKHIFAPEDVTRMEMILGSDPLVYLNSEYQGQGYSYWSPVAVDSGLVEASDNIISVKGSLPNTESRIYSGSDYSDGKTIDVEQDVFYTVFGVREKNYVPGREKFYVYPNETVTARIRIDNFFSDSRVFNYSLYVVDFINNQETVLFNGEVDVLPFDSKYIEVNLTIPGTVSYDTKLQLYNVWNNNLKDKNWLRASNVDDVVASNIFLDDSAWGVIELSSGVENAIYYRKHLWVDSHTEAVKLKLDDVESLWVNDIPVDISSWSNKWNELNNNEVTKSAENLFTIKAKNNDLDADLQLLHFVPVRTTDLELVDLDHTDLKVYGQDSIVCYFDETLCNCSNSTCTYVVKQGNKVEFNFTIRNTGELFANDFILSGYVRNKDTYEIIEFASENLTMHPFSVDEDWTVIIDTSHLAGNYEFVISVDRTDTVIESSEYNNKFLIDVIVNTQPEIEYIDRPILTGYNKPAEIKVKVEDDNNVTVKGYVNNVLIANSSFNYSDNKPLINNISFEGVDILNNTVIADEKFGIFSSIYLNARAEKDLYYLGEVVSLTENDNIVTDKTYVDNGPVLLSYYEEDLVDMILIRTNAYDPDGDIVELKVCKDIGCTELYCSQLANINPSCMFEKEEGFNVYYVSAGNMIMGDYEYDLTPPDTEVILFASENSNIDRQDDMKTLITVEGNEDIKCRWGLDDEFRLHKDRSYPNLMNDCESSGEVSICNLGDIDPSTIPRDELTNLSMVHISCNEQDTISNIDFEFDINFGLEVYDDYDGSLIDQGDTVTIYGETEYCVDETGTCTPNLAIENAPVTFTVTAHLRYMSGLDVMDTLVMVNAPFELNVEIFDVVGEHSFEVFGYITDLDSSGPYSCVLFNNGVPYLMEVVDKLAKATVSNSANITVECSDKYDTVVSDNIDYVNNNMAPIIRFVPDISLNIGEIKNLDLEVLTYDIENDNYSIEIVSLSDDVVNVSVLDNKLQVIGLELGIAELCLRANDVDVGETFCTNVIVQDEMYSKIVNNEYVSTQFDLVLKIQYNSSSWEDIHTEILTVDLVNGEMLALKDLFSSWDTLSSPYSSGQFRLIVMSMDGNDTLTNRDGTEILSEFKFVLNHVNTAPEISSIPMQGLFSNTTETLFDLKDYTDDAEQSIDDLVYMVVNQSNNIINCSISGSELLCAVDEISIEETSIVTVGAFDGYLYGYQDVMVTAYPTSYQFVGNLSYEFSWPFNDNGTWQTEVGDAGDYNVTINETGLGHFKTKTILVRVFENITNVTKPALIIDSPENDTTYPSQMIMINLTIPGDVNAVWYYINSTKFVYSAPIVHTFPLGMNLITIFANDTENNIFNYTSTFFVNVTNVTKPEVIIDSPANGSVHTSQIVLINITIPSGVDIVWYYFNGTKMIYINPINHTFAPGMNMITIFANDTENNIFNYTSTFFVNVSCVTNLDCDNGLYCDGVENCVDNQCLPGTPINCSLNNLGIINTCVYDPDNNSLTLDYFGGFLSVCDEVNDTCTIGSIELDYTCSVSECGAECDTLTNCTATECDHLDKCIGDDYYDYFDMDNTCKNDCTCMNVSCSALNISLNDPRCIAPEEDGLIDVNLRIELDSSKPHLYWDDITDAIAYNIYKGPALDNINMLVENTTDTDWRDDLYTPGKTLYRIGVLFNPTENLSTEIAGIDYLEMQDEWNLFAMEFDQTYKDLGEINIVGNPVLTDSDCLTEIDGFDTDHYIPVTYFSGWGWWSDDLTEVEEFNGYFGYSEGTCNYISYGIVYNDPMSYNLPSGWNLIGWSYPESRVLGNESEFGVPILMNPAGCINHIYYYNGTDFIIANYFTGYGWDSVSGLTELIEGKGYFIWLDSACEVTFVP